jgi:hypothetical protein
MRNSTPKLPIEWPRLKFGIPAILSQSDVVSRSFGPNRGFMLMVLALIAATSVSLVTALLVLKGLSRFIF